MSEVNIFDNPETDQSKKFKNTEFAPPPVSDTSSTLETATENPTRDQTGTGFEMRTIDDMAQYDSSDDDNDIYGDSESDSSSEEIRKKKKKKSKKSKKSKKEKSKKKKDKKSKSKSKSKKSKKDKKDKKSKKKSKSKKKGKKDYTRIRSSSKKGKSEQ